MVNSERLKHIAVLWLLLMGSATAFSTNYQKTFGDDWDDAVRFVKVHHEEWQQEFDLFDVDSRVAEAIVFPELIRYSMWQDEIERAAVNGLYVTKGREGANFSIGRFQMKPSFAEEALYHAGSVSLFGYFYPLVATTSSPTFSATCKGTSLFLSHSL